MGLKGVTLIHPITYELLLGHSDRVISSFFLGSNFSVVAGGQDLHLTLTVFSSLPMKIILLCFKCMCVCVAFRRLTGTPSETMVHCLQCLASVGLNVMQRASRVHAEATSIHQGGGGVCLCFQCRALCREGKPGCKL